MSEGRTYIIDKSKWVFGGRLNRKRLGLSRLLNDEGNMCCLGQCALQDGAKDLENELTPSNVRGQLPRDNWMVNEVGNDSGLADEAMCINDSPALTQREREKRLREVFRKAGHRIKFINNRFPEQVRKNPGKRKVG